MTVNLPTNPLIQPHTADTLQRAAFALATLEAIRPDEIPTKEIDPEGLGLAALLKTVRDAISHEAERLTARTG